MAKTIYCLAEMAYQFDGELDLMGGGEKYLDDFITLLKKSNYNVKLYQFSYKKFTKKWRKHTIYGLGNISNPMYPISGYLQGLTDFHEQAKSADGIFYLSMNLSNGLIKKPILTVSHGLMIDRCEKDLTTNPVNNLEALKKWIRSSTHTISVDTNTIKVNAVYYPDNLKKMTYIPNYVDLDVFKTIEKEDNSKFTILYPRRLDVARGYRTAMKSCEYLLNKYDNFEFIFCGRGNEYEENEFTQWHSKLSFKDRVKHFSLESSKMYQAYQMATCSIVPTWYSEGTSLSALESIASGVIPIVTCVGGLTDLVFPNVNGLMVMPKDENALTEAIEYLYNNQSERERMRENGLRMIQAFSKERWQNDVLKVVKKVFGEP